MRIKQKLTQFDWNKWTHNTLVFLAPLVGMYLIFVQANIQLDGFQLVDLHPTPEVTGAVVLYLINVSLDFLKKYRQV